MNASRIVSSPGLEWLRRLSRRAWWLHALLIGQLALLPCPLSRGVWVEVDTDGDGLVDSGYEDGVSEGLAEDTQAVAEPDADGDGLSDAEEAVSGSDPYNPDSDYDGLTDADEVRLSGTSPLLADSDGDGISDYNAFYGNTAVDTLWAGEGVTAYDWDGDGLHDPVDPDPYSAQNIGDADGDHVPDPEDSHPLDPTLWCDSNGNGVNDDAEADGADFDGDGVSDATDSHPADPGLDNDWNDNGVDDEHEDGDGDGVSNLQDSHPNSNSLWCDWNGNGVNDDAEAAVAAGHVITGSVEESQDTNPTNGVMQDQDGDGYADERDSHPADPGLWNDHNGNGRNDDEEAPADTDRDGIPDALDAAPADHDNDGLTDTEEWTLGTDPAAADSDGDGLSDGEEVYAGTDPWSVDTDGDGLTDSEELLAYHTDPLEPTAIAPPETANPAEAESIPATGSALLRVSHLVPDPGSETGQRRVEHPDGGRLAFPSKSALKSRADLTKTLTVTNGSATMLSGLSASLSGPDAAHFRLGSLANTDLAPGAERTLPVTFLAPTPATDARSATLTLHGGEPAMPLLVLNLRSVVSSGLWTTHDDYFFADYTDSDEDGIPDLVEAMYAPLEVTATGDLDGDGTSNLDQYLAGRDLRDRAKSTDTDADGLTNATEDAWSAAYPGRLNKYHFADAYADPDGDGLLTIEELNCLWGSDKDPHAVATHPFVAGSPPASASKTATYKTTSRKPPKTAPASAAGETASGPLASRAGLYAAWMNDGQLRRACRETAHANGGKLPADFFTPERVVHAATATLQKNQGSDHLPRGYLLWLGRQNPAIPLPAPAPAPAMPDNEAVQSQLLGLQLPDASDADGDAMPTAWEAAYDLDWRSPADSHLRHALEALDQRLASLASDPTDLIRSAEQEAVAEVRQRLLAAQTAWPAITYPATFQNQTQTVQSHLVPVYAVDRVKYPASLSAAAAADATRRAAWISKFTAALHWQMLAGFDPDHDGLMNQDEYQQGLSPLLPDYEATGERDSDGDGFIDAIELATGTDHLDARKRPVYAIEILKPVKERTGTTLQPLTVPVQTGLRGPTGLWPLGAQSLTVSAPDTQCLLAWGQDHATVDWHPKTVPVGVTNDQGRITLHVHPGWKKGGTKLIFRSTPGAGLPAGLKPVRVTCDLKITAPTEDSDTDGLPDAWEARLAQGPGDPAHSLSKASALDAEAGPQHFGYHPSTPAERLPEVVLGLLNEWKAVEADLGYLPEHPAMTATLTPLAVPATEEAITTARHKILALIDPDHDGWSNRVEWENGTHPRVPDNPATATRDTDGDGVADVLEWEEGTNPKDPGSVPVLSLTDARLNVVWGSGQSAAPGSLAPQPVVVQLSRGNGTLLKRVALEASCSGGHFAVPATRGKNVQWQPDSVPLVTDAQGKVSFHFWTPADASPKWTIRIRNVVNASIETAATVTNAGSGSGGTSGGGRSPGAGDRRLNSGEQPGFDSSQAPFVIRFQGWRGGIISHEENGGSFASGNKPYKARIQNKRWEYHFGSPMVVNDGPATVQEIGNHTAESAEAWKNSQTQKAPAYQVKEYNKEWFSGDEGFGFGSAYYELFEEDPETSTRRILNKITLVNWSDAVDYDTYETPAADYLLPGSNLWRVVEAVWADNGDPQLPSEKTAGDTKVKHYYMHLAPETFSHVEQMGLDVRRMSVEVTGSQDAEERFRELGVELPIAEKRLPNQNDDEWKGQVAGAIASMSRVITDDNEQAYTALKTRGKVLIDWDFGYPVSLSDKSREAWLQRYLVIRTERIERVGVDEAEVITHTTPLNQLLNLTSSHAATLDLDPGPLEVGVKKTVTLSLVAWDLAIDANRDGTITQGEIASEERPFRFWINNDHDSSRNEGENVRGENDNADNVIANERDLEDFQLLHFNIPEILLKEASRGKAHIGLRWKSTNGTDPSVRIFRARSGIQSSNDYLWNSKNAELQVQGSRYSRAVATVTGSVGVPLPHDIIYYSSNGFGHTGDPYLLFEGVTSGSGQLCLVIKLEGGAIIEGPGPWLKLCDIKKMYVRSNQSEFEPPPAGTESQEVLTFVHGWNMSPEGAAVFAETLYKRLWHKGFRGRFAAFRWNTDWSDAFDNVPGVGEPVEAYLADYNGSELIAWNSGLDLKNFVNRRPSSYRSMLVAHSMGNIVAGSALAQGLSVDKYVLLQAAVPACCYDDRQEIKEAEQYQHRIPFIPDPTMWDEWTPDDDYDPEAYRGKLMGIGGSPTSFYQSNDIATSFAWEVNNDLTKPPGKIAGNYKYYRYRDPGKRCIKLIEDRHNGGYKQIVLTGYDALTKSCRSWSKTVGANGATRGAIKEWVDNDESFGFDDEHSAEFNRCIQKLDYFFEALKEQLKIQTP